MLKILMPIDFSESSLNAMSYAAQMTKAFHAKLILMHVVEPVGGDATMFVDDHIITEETSEAKKKLENLTNELDDINTPYIETLVCVGFPVDKILATAKEQQVSLIVMGTTGTTNKFEDILGSNTYKVVKNTKCAVVTIPLESKKFNIKKIALAVDLHKKENIHLLTILRHFLRHFKAQIFFLHVSKGEHPSLADDAHSDAVLWLAEKFREFEHSFVNVSSENVAESINEYAYQNDIDMLALSPESHNIFGQLFKGSTTRNLVLHSHVPLLTLPADY
ncbi:universal stress protein [Fulvivirga sp. 29W222]|uniref:Universal stress protein n=1 Tax=Fulvivirga marina TaxID=2494733 RepID=A0A937KG61_9BACT|nr:universal stress protein [Fulvivirga marina]MBL6448863.1 universal stress protein [Fulvivirga marina]